MLTSALWTTGKIATFQTCSCWKAASSCAPGLALLRTTSSIQVILLARILQSCVGWFQVFSLRTGAPEFLKYMQENPWFESTCLSSPSSRTRLFHVANLSSRHAPPISSRVQRQVHDDLQLSYLICVTGLVDDAILESIRREEPGKSLQTDSSDFLRTPEKTKPCTPRVTESVILQPQFLRLNRFSSD